jgi:hypothetical protein
VAALGSVTDFSPERGLGEVRLDDGVVLGFHATAIADGTRQIPVGTRVLVVERPTHRGLRQVVDLARISG